MFRPTEWGSSKGKTGRRLLATSAIAVVAVAGQSVPAGAATDVEGDTARASASVLASGSATIAGSSAVWASDPGPNRSGRTTTLGDGVVTFGQAGVLGSVSTTTSPLSGSAISGFVGSDGQITLDGLDGGFQPATVDLLSFMKQGGADLSDALVDEATLRLGVGGSEVIARSGVLLDPDRVGGIGRYRVGQADLDLRSPKVDEAAAMIYDAVGRFDDLTEDRVNKLLALTTITSKLPAGMTLTAKVRSNMQDQVFRDILARPITTKNKVLTVDFSTGKVTLHLDQFLHGEELVDGPVLDGQTVRPGDPTGLNNQQPNTEIIDDEIYPMIAETIHDLMDEVVTIAVGAVEGSLSAVHVDFISQLKAPLGTATSTWTVNLGGEQIRPALCFPSGLMGPALCKTLTGTINTLIVPTVNKLLVPVRDALVGDAGAVLYGLAVEDLKTGLITIPVRRAVEPFLEAFSRSGVSVQVNSQRLSRCTSATGVTRISGAKVSAFSIAMARGTGGPSINLGNSGVTTRCVGTLTR